MKTTILCAYVLATMCQGSIADWPMLGNSPERKGTTTDEIRPPFARKWYRVFADEGIQSGAQPVVAAGRVYLGTLRGVMHAMDARTGADLWVFRAGGPILHAAGVYQGMVFFGSGDGCVYAVNASDGTACWKFQTGSAIWNAPAIAEDTVFIGSRDGCLYALDVVTGREKWRGQTAGPILNSPALDLSRGVAYVGSESMRVHAFRLTDGKELWRSEQLPGASMRGYHPVIAPDGSVLVTVMPVISYDRFQELLLEMTKAIFGDFASWRHKPEENARLRRRNFEQFKDPRIYKRQMEWLRARLTASPQFQTLFILDPATGNRKAVPPVVSSESMNGPAAPGIVTADGKVIVKFQALLRSRYEHYSPFLNVGYLDTATGDITPLLDESRTYGWHDSLLLVHDEQSQLTAAGGVLINTHQDNVNALDLRTARGFESPFAWNIHEPAPGEALALAAKLLAGEQVSPGNEWLARGVGVYGGGSVLDTSVVVDGDSFYYLPTHELNSGCILIAYEMKPGARFEKRDRAKPVTLSQSEREKLRKQPWDWDTLGTPRLKNVLEALPGVVPGTAASPARANSQTNAWPTDAQLEELVWSAYEHLLPVASSQPHLVRKLEEAVAEMLADELQPLVIPAGKAPEQAYRFFTEPSQTVYALALARPFLNIELQRKADARAEALLRDGLRRYDPERGKNRVPYAIAPELMKVRDDQEPSRDRQLHAAWAWARAAGRAADLPRLWPQWKDALKERERTEEDCGNGQIAAAIAYCHIARGMGDLEAVREGLAGLRKAVRSRLEFEQTHAKGGLIRAVPQGRMVMARWRNLTPEVARVLLGAGPNPGRHAEKTNQVGSVHADLMAIYVDHHRPGWWLAWNVEQLMRNEVPTQLPSTPMEIFTARALLLEENSSQLERYLDLPWCKADEYYVHKLALTLRVGAFRAK